MFDEVKRGRSRNTQVPVVMACGMIPDPIDRDERYGTRVQTPARNTA